MIDKYFDLNQSKMAFQIFDEIKSVAKPNLATFKIMLSSPSALAFRKELTIQLQNKPNKNDFEKCVYIMALGRRSYFEQAMLEFQSFQSPNLELWYSMLYACSLNGKGDVSMQMLDKMQNLGITPDMACYQIVLSATSYESNISGAEVVYQKAKGRFKVSEGIDVAMIDAYARGGYLDKAENLAQKASKKKVVAFITVLAGCKKYGDLERMKRIMKEQAYLQDNAAALFFDAKYCNSWW
jgi:pentatricopeptide repeat protein